MVIRLTCGLATGRWLRVAGREEALPPSVGLLQKEASLSSLSIRVQPAKTEPTCGLATGRWLSVAGREALLPSVGLLRKDARPLGLGLRGGNMRVGGGGRSTACSPKSTLQWSELDELHTSKQLSAKLTLGRFN